MPKKASKPCALNRAKNKRGRPGIKSRGHGRGKGRKGLSCARGIVKGRSTHY